MKEQTGMKMEQIAVLCAASANCIYDIKRREIIFIPTIAFAAAGVFYGFVTGRGVADVLSGLLPGALLAVIAILSRGNVGMGDAIMIGAVGAWIGCTGAFVTLMTAFGIQAAVSVIYRLSGGRKKELPFLPAVLVGFIVYMLIM